MIGALGLELMEWLRSVALPEEARLEDSGYAASVADHFARGLARNGTTTALVFGSHFVEAQEALFSAASAAGLRVASGLVVSDRGLLPELHMSPESSFESSRDLITRWHVTTWRLTSDTGWSASVRCSPTTFRPGTPSCCGSRPEPAPPPSGCQTRWAI